MEATYGKKLIWQADSPSPYESGWSIFTKLLLYNHIKPQNLAKHISFSENADRYLTVFDSSWIDFDKFSFCIDSNPDRLKKGFLDQFGLSGHRLFGTGIKQCSECIKFGYHCVFFQLPFITHCPWHNQKLSPPCDECMNVVIKKGFHSSKESGFLRQMSSCGHINSHDLSLASTNMLTREQESTITKFCELLLEWWTKVHTSADIRNFLSKQYDIKDRFNKLPIYLSAAESIAGPCPWQTEIVRNNIRTLHWKQEKKSNIYNYELDQDSVFEPDSARRKSDLDLAYRSVRRYFLRRFMKSHRCCWNELTNYNYQQALSLQSDSVCTVSLALATWRLGVEWAINIEAFKTNKLCEREILAYRIQSDQFTNTFEAHISLLYAYFFYLWKKISDYSGQEKFFIIQNIISPTKSVFVASYTSGEWVVAFPDYVSLELGSFIRCSGQLKNWGWMLAGNQYDYFQNLNSLNGPTNGCMFKLFKDKRGGYQYINA